MDAIAERWAALFHSIGLPPAVGRVAASSLLSDKEVFTSEDVIVWLEQTKGPVSIALKWMLEHGYVECLSPARRTSAARYRLSPRLSFLIISGSLATLDELASSMGGIASSTAAEFVNSSDRIIRLAKSGG